MQPGRVYAYEELDGITAKERDDFREDFLRAADFEHLLIFRVAEPGGCIIWVTVTRPAAAAPFGVDDRDLCARSEAHTSELQSLMRISYAVFCMKKNKENK